MLSTCPVCNGEAMVSVRRSVLPIFQNVTYETQLEALGAPVGEFSLATCRSCGFSYNGDFDAKLVTYDENYDNHVASAVFEQYYLAIATQLKNKFDLTSGIVYDIGCGNGEFLKVFCETASQIHGVGIDPSCTPMESGNFQLIQSEFEGSRFDPGTRLVVLRHVLEHISQPLAFLISLREAMPDVPLYVEVPDLDWIVENQAFWDFCYEHCNYFTSPSLRTVLERAGFDVEEQGLSFGNQYQWAIGRPAKPMSQSNFDVSRSLQSITDYAAIEGEHIGALKKEIEAGGEVVIWGMATKGVILSLLLGKGLVRCGIDMNIAKQKRFTAVAGVEIQPPSWLKGKPEQNILIMNPNYANEIAETLKKLGVSGKIRNL